MKTKAIAERLKAGDVLVLRESCGYEVMKKDHEYTIKQIDGSFVEFDLIDPDHGDNVEVHITNVINDFEIVPQIPLTKKLYVMVQDAGDGSYYTHYTFNENFIKEMEERDRNGQLEYDDLGCDGDGFHYKVLTVPAECTLVTLGIHCDAAED